MDSLGTKMLKCESSMAWQGWSLSPEGSEHCSECQATLLEQLP